MGRSSVDASCPIREYKDRSSWNNCYPEMPIHKSPSVLQPNDWIAGGVDGALSYRVVIWRAGGNKCQKLLGSPSAEQLVCEYPGTACRLNFGEGALRDFWSLSPICFRAKQHCFKWQLHCWYKCDGVAVVTDLSQVKPLYWEPLLVWEKTPQIMPYSVPKFQ